MKKKFLKKGLICGIIIFFLGMNIISIAGSVSIEKEQSVMSKSYFDGLVFDGIIGENGWYVSGVVIMAEGDTEYIRINEGDWFTYNSPLTLSDGIYLIEWTSDMEHFYSKLLKIDQTSPEIILMKETAGTNKVKFIANVYDATSGIWRIEFYIDNELIDTDTVFPFEWTWTGSGNHIVTAKVFDMAGNSAGSSMSTPYTQNHIRKSLYNQQINQLLQNLILRYQMIKQILK